MEQGLLFDSVVLASSPIVSTYVASLVLKGALKYLVVIAFPEPDTQRDSLEVAILEIF